MTELIDQVKNDKPTIESCNLSSIEEIKPNSSIKIKLKLNLKIQFSNFQQEISNPKELLRQLNILKTLLNEKRYKELKTFCNVYPDDLYFPEAYRIIDSAFDDIFQQCLLQRQEIQIKNLTEDSEYGKKCIEELKRIGKIQNRLLNCLVSLQEPTHSRYRIRQQNQQRLLQQYSQ